MFTICKRGEPAKRRPRQHATTSIFPRILERFEATQGFFAAEKSRCHQTDSGGVPRIMIACAARLIPILAMMSAFGPVATDMYLPGFAQMADSFQTTSSRIESTLSAFFLGLALGQSLYGPVIDRFGRRLPLLGGIALFALATVGSVLTQDIDVFIGLRFLQGIGGCAGIVIGRAIVNDLFTPRESARVLSLMMILITVAPIVAPVIGSLILAFAHWRVIFLLVLLFALACFWMVWQHVPETLTPERQQPLNLKNVWRAYSTLVCQWSFIQPALVGGLSMSSLFAFITGSPFVLMDVFGVSEQQYAWLFGLVSAGLIIGSQLNRMCLRRWSSAQVLGVALGVGLLASLLLLTVAGSSHLWLFLVPLWIALATLGLISANAAALAMSRSGPYTGSGSALFGTLQFGIAFVVSSLLASAQSGSAWPLAIAIAACSLLASSLWFGGRRRVEPVP